MRFMGKSNRNMIAKWLRDRVLRGGGKSTKPTAIKEQRILFNIK